MVYLAILLILCGLLILISALFIEKGRGGVSGYNDPESAAGLSSHRSVDSDSNEVEMIFPGDRTEETDAHTDEEDIFISFDDDSENLYDYEEFPGTEITSGSSFKPGDDYHQSERIKSDYAEKAPAAGSDEEIYPLRRSDDQSSKYVSAVMFDDRSNIIDYESGVGAIDSTFSRYKSIKRIGKGRIESDFDGVNFYIDEKLYRFDFHKVYDIWSGPGYIALPLKGNSTVKLFLIENSPGFPDKVEADYKEYEKGL
ncbi:MAG: hypothetical protein CVV49_03360 [Spirochaetae bacterium HGW-Spirochaetae-5]|nr:MAG: hypothetical protein CVV49_03360 [Spirochaetae bacterium HGW-Spirochaetae-5]